MIFPFSDFTRKNCKSLNEGRDSACSKSTKNFDFYLEVVFPTIFSKTFLPHPNFPISPHRLDLDKLWFESQKTLQDPSYCYYF